ncbi:hypothetical protein [Nostoc sp. C117]|uniref:hypothetical protein n=1 Tax=Nostoc sp. C117 TaxID=3349875 RepID=UPI00370D2895
MNGLWGGKARIYELPIRIMTFNRLWSDRAKIATLRLGYSPAIDLAWAVALLCAKACFNNAQCILLGLVTNN